VGRKKKAGKSSRMVKKAYGRTGSRGGVGKNGRLVNGGTRICAQWGGEGTSTTSTGRGWCDVYLRTKKPGGCLGGGPYIW